MHSQIGDPPPATRFVGSFACPRLTKIPAEGPKRHAPSTSDYRAHANFIGTAQPKWTGVRLQRLRAQTGINRPPIRGI